MSGEIFQLFLVAKLIQSSKFCIQWSLHWVGEPISAEPGKLFRLETVRLRMEGRAVDVSYGDLPLLEDSYFQGKTIELPLYLKKSLYVL